MFLSISRTISLVSVSAWLVKVKNMSSKIVCFFQVEKEEKPWVLLSGSAELTQALVDWVRTQWEAMFGVRLMTSLLEGGS